MLALQPRGSGRGACGTLSARTRAVFRSSRRDVPPAGTGTALCFFSPRPHQRPWTRFKRTRWAAAADGDGLPSDPSTTPSPPSTRADRPASSDAPGIPPGAPSAVFQPGNAVSAIAGSDSIRHAAAADVADQIETVPAGHPEIAADEDVRAKRLECPRRRVDAGHLPHLAAAAREEHPFHHRPRIVIVLDEKHPDPRKIDPLSLAPAVAVSRRAENRCRRRRRRRIFVRMRDGPSRRDADDERRPLAASSLPPRSCRRASRRSDGRSPAPVPVHRARGCWSRPCRNRSRRPAAGASSLDPPPVVRDPISTWS